jgi:hypothetical protein
MKNRFKTLIDKSPAAVITGIALIIVIIVAVVVVIVAENKKTVSITKPTYTVRKACNILTSSVAAKFIGSDLKKTTVPDSSANSTNISYCSYNGSTGTLSLTIRSPLNQTAATANINQFGENIPIGVQTIGGYGSAAYWNASYSQFNILDHDTWYTLTADSKSQVEQLAKTLIKQF